VTELASLDPAAITAAIIGRAAARRAKEFAASDAIRTKLQEAGVVLEDLPEGAGVRWKLRA
jgi:cysteinyl-tRNA synthetase